MLQNCTIWNVAKVFFDEPTKYHGLREISRKANLAHTSVKNHLKKLKEENIINEEKEFQGDRTYPKYKVSQSENYSFYKKIDILSRIKESGLLEFLEKKYAPDCIVLFGSASKGDDIETSDIDFYMQASEKKVNLEKFESQLKRKIQLHFKQRIKDYPVELMNNIINGNILYGLLDIECEK